MMKSLFLWGALSFCTLVSCRDDDPLPEGETNIGGHGGETSTGEVPTRKLPQCRDYSPGERIELRTDYFESSCAFDAEPLADTARTWTAPQDGYYRVMTRVSAYEGLSPILEVRPGDCTEDDQVGAGGASPALCGEDFLTENGYPNESHSLFAQKGETYTFVLEGRVLGDEESEVVLRVDEAMCPSARIGGAEYVDRIENLPIDVEFTLGYEAEHVRDVSCGPSGANVEQGSVYFSAPEDGTFQFSLEELSDWSDISLAVLEEECSGSVLACAAGGGEDKSIPKTVVELERGQTVVILMSRDVPSDDDMTVRLRVSEVEP